MEKYDVAIVGGGAAGLACAVGLSSASRLKIIVFEACPRAGRKLSASGNGQGNIFNSDRDISHYRSGNLPLVQKIACDSSKSAEWACDEIFGEMLYKYGAYGRAYPQSMQASSLTDLLLRRLAAGGVNLRLSAKVDKIQKSGSGFGIYGGDFNCLADYVVIAAGGKAQKQYGTDGSAYKLAEAFGHAVTPLYPSIVQLKTNTEHIANLKGIRAYCAVKATGAQGEDKSFCGDIIFTEYGVTGNAAFFVSPALTPRGGSLSLDFAPERAEEELFNVLCRRAEQGAEQKDILCGIVHNQIARAVIKRACGGIREIVETLKNFTLEVTGTLGFDYAQVTRGGVDMREISDDLESKLCKNLYFAGEILDVDGDCGGYNLNWAFTSGLTVARAIAAKT